MKEVDKVLDDVASQLDMAKPMVSEGGELLNSLHIVLLDGEKNDVDIICKRHGVFHQKPYIHTSGSGCPRCKESKGEKIISWFLNKKNIKYETQKTFPGCVDVNQLRFDFYIPEYNTCIEYNGIQHYKSINHFGGDTSFEQRQINDNIKLNYTIDNEIPFIIIPYNISNKEDIYKNH